jgi:alkanesulfonate monooxygenase SsuD/methylene tetrahydromethanopterin reductase-like flavin-dependent oxidoreductase (luciferase family)
MAERIDEQRRSLSPLFNRRKLRLGTFCTNASHGCVISTVDGALRAEWRETAELARLADEMEFEAIVPIGRWRGFGGVTDFNGASFETYTWAAGISEATRYSSVFATSHVPTIHPLVAAKQAATIDHISSGRFTLNIVTGWFRPEMEMFGVTMLEHDTRYDFAAEWLEIVKRLWTEDEPIDHQGRFFKLKRAVLQPKPIQKPYPVLMNAGGSEKGRHFAARYCDVAFVVLERHDLESLKARVDHYRKFAREQYGREIGVWTNAYIYQADSEREARAFYNHVVNEKGDWQAVDNMLTTMGIESEQLPVEAMEGLKRHFIAGWCGYPLVGTKEQIVDGFEILVKAGFDGILLSWPLWREGMRQFRAETLPLLKQAGLR